MKRLILCLYLMFFSGCATDMASGVIDPADVLFDVVMPIGEAVGGALEEAKESIGIDEKEGNQDEENSDKKGSGSGFALGMKGSIMWNATASQETIDAYYAKMDITEICYQWERFWEAPRVRRSLSRALSLRGEDPMLCSNPVDDLKKQTSSEIKKIKKETDKMKRELQDSKNELEKLKRDMQFDCITSGGVMVGNNCMY